ncbi:MAG: TetR family transcriptional regulator C-terminal domain-containing protein [Pseudomonadota bacterium]
MDTLREIPPARQDNRQLLIDATLASIAEIGLIRTSVTEIVIRAGLSRGMIHLHFKSKDNLLAAAAEESSEQYFERLEQYLSQAAPEPQNRIEALILADLSEDGLTEDFVRITQEFQAATRALPILAPYSDTRDARLRHYFEEAFMQIMTQTREPDPLAVSQDLTTGLVAMMEGFWVDFLLHPQDFDRARAARIVFRMLSGLLPDHFDLEGAKTPK